MSPSAWLAVVTLLVIVGLVSMLRWCWGLLVYGIVRLGEDVHLAQLDRIADTMEGS